MTSNLFYNPNMEKLLIHFRHQSKRTYNPRGLDVYKIELRR